MPLTPEARSIPYRKRNPAQFARERCRVLSCFESLDRELTRGEIRFYALNWVATSDLQEILDDLVQSGCLLVRTVPQPRFNLGVSHCYRRPASVTGGV